jgi:hypothetical protein
MARYFTLLTLALVTATQTAQAFPTEELYGGYNVQVDGVRIGRMDFRPVRNCLLILEVAAEEDPALADAFESVLEMHLDDDVALEVMLDLITIEEAFNQGDGSSMTFEASLDAVAGDSTWSLGSMILNQLAIESEKSAAGIDRRIPSHRKRH